MPDANATLYASFKRRLIIGFSLLVTLLVLSLVWKIFSSYETEKKTVEKQTQNFVQAMSAHVVGTIRLIDFSLANTAEAIKTLGAASEHSTEAIKNALAGAGRLSDANFWIIFIDAQGRGVAASNGLPVSGMSYVDRPYFSAHAQGADIGLFVGEPALSKLSKKRVFYLSRRISSATGEFIGVVAAPVDAKIFADVFVNALFQPQLSITLAHTSGKVIARVPRFDETFASNITKSPLFDHLRIAPNGSYEATSVLDNDTRIYSFKTLDHFPLVVSVGMSSKSWTEGLYADFLVGVVGLVVIIAVLFFSGHFALRSYRRLAENESNLRRVNDALEIAQEALSRLARIDSLTGLPNRNYLYDRLAEAIARGYRNGTKVGCLYLDIDGFKQVNDTLGHAGGDELLKQFGARVYGCMRQTDMLARLAGDEFVAVIEGLDQPDAACLVAAKIIEQMQIPFMLEGKTYPVTTSIGVAIAEGQIDDADSLLRKADDALYTAKRQGKNVFLVYQAPETSTAKNLEN
jgi:diguanylate cyclase (GGDEF)-like protein